MGSEVVIRVLATGFQAQDTRTLSGLLTEELAILLVGATSRVSRVPALLKSREPDVVLLQAGDPQVALDAIRSILAQAHEARIVAILDAFSLNEAAAIIEHGARGIMTVRELSTMTVRAIRAVHTGEIWGSHAVLSRIVRATIERTVQADAVARSLPDLTGREIEIIDLLRIGASNKEIASQLRISDQTVKTHLRNIFGKLHVHRREKLIPALLH